ncbi:MAG: cell division protein [Candidatus Liberibacter europaeus]|uniref:Cell division protein n=1 Tax=Candidatus Liberibacter europaeus TaxID=744859 RepID=A0A2T4VXT7_9HYPH|nr:cell division protein [Candidatus Liberibacter europaeus]PTL86580.1 MAG: cell division protein [Candidatus Liberibacter europaeus]
MWDKYYKKDVMYITIFRIISVSVIIYFVNHTIEGDYGLRATKSLEESLIKREISLAELRETRAKLEHKIKLLSDGFLEKDLLDEKARFNLNLSRTDEIVLFLFDF